jgi:hypothetical protein
LRRSKAWPKCPEQEGEEEKSSCQQPRKEGHPRREVIESRFHSRHLPGINQQLLRYLRDRLGRPTTVKHPLRRRLLEARNGLRSRTSERGAFPPMSRIYDEYGWDWQQG